MQVSSDPRESMVTVKNVSIAPNVEEAKEVPIMRQDTAKTDVGVEESSTNVNGPAEEIKKQSEPTIVPQEGSKPPQQ